MDLLIQESEWGQRSNMSNLENKDFELENYTPTSEDFTFVQADTKIYDKKFETKTTTFAKDAFKRFCKNKSSVVGAIIIGTLLLLSFIMPLVIPYDLENADISHALLKPKLFEAGTGFWDGTKKYYNVSWNPETNSPNGFKGSAVVEIFDEKVDELTNTPKETASGGYLKFVATTTGSDVQFVTNHTDSRFKITADGGYNLDIKLGTVDDLGGKLGEYRILLRDGSTEYVLLDWTKNHTYENGTISFNLSEFISSKGLTEVPKAVIRIELKKNATVETYMLIESIIITANNIDDYQEEKFLEEISLTDANAAVLMKKSDAGKFPLGYWQSTGRRDLYAAKVRRVSFVYDTYEAALGLTKNMQFGGSDIEKYIANGWCEYDFKKGPESFKVLDPEKCPVLSITKAEYYPSKDVYVFEGDVIYYKYKGMEKMPTYLLGTTAQGKDLIKLAFVSLRTSLLIAIISSAICLAFGLVWGSISGYFGGNVDLAMERFCEILSGVPFLVVMTLTILLLGNNIITFALALCLTGWLGVAGRTRTQFYRFKGREYILASRTLGSSDKRLIFRHILPNALGTIVTGSILMIPSVIFSESTLAYLNLGLQGVESFGVLLSSNQKYLETEPALVVFPALIISMLMISFNLFGNGLRDALNPSLKGSE